MKHESKMKWCSLICILTLVIGGWGCSKKEEAPVVETVVEQPKELPVLQQNLIHKSNRSKRLPPPDFGFREAEDDSFENEVQTPAEELVD